jgi:acetoin utilization deacetylase AcuC-like enzyme
VKSFISFRKEYAHPLPENHRFPMLKYELLPEQLKREGIVEDSDFFEPQEIAEEDILRAHSEDYLRQLENLSLSPREQRKTGFPHSPQLIEREKIIMQGSLDAAKAALDGGLGFNIAGGTHHAYTNRGEGFCLLNDIAITALHLLTHKLVKQVLVVDLDVHQGNGTAEICAGNNRIFTFSMHGKANYPLHKEKSDLDIPLETGTGGDVYLPLLEQNLERLLNQVKPDFVIYQSGVDVLKTDKLGHLGLSKAECKERDQIVYSKLHSKDIPVMACMGGGYSEKVADIVDAHANTYRVAREVYH